MQATNSSIPLASSSIRPSFTRASLERPSSEPKRIPAHRVMRFQLQTSLYLHLDMDPQHRLAHCSTVYELEDRTKPSISSF